MDDKIDDNKARTILELYAFEGNITWSRYNVMLVANSIILGGIALLLTDRHLFLPFVLVCGGFLICLLWYRLTVIGFKMVGHYYEKMDTLIPEANEAFSNKPSWGCWDVPPCAKAVIYIFFVIYGFVALWLIMKFLCSFDLCQCLT